MRLPPKPLTLLLLAALALAGCKSVTPNRCQLQPEDGRLVFPDGCYSPGEGRDPDIHREAPEPPPKPAPDPKPTPDTKPPPDPKPGHDHQGAPGQKELP